MNSQRLVLAGGSGFLGSVLAVKSRRVVPGKWLAEGFVFRHPNLLPGIEQLARATSAGVPARPSGIPAMVAAADSGVM